MGFSTFKFLSLLTIIFLFSHSGFSQTVGEPKKSLLSTAEGLEQTLWSDWVILIEKVKKDIDNEQAINKLIKSLKEKALDRGVYQLETMAIATSNEGMKALEGKNFKMAKKYFLIARDLDPYQPDSYFGMAELLLKKSPLNIFSAIKETIAGLSALYSSFMEKFFLYGNLMILVYTALLMACPIFVLFLFAHYFNLPAHDIKELLPRAMPLGVINSMVFFFLLLPLFLGLGIFFIIAWWTLLIWVYLSRAEKGIIYGILVFFLLIPTLSSYVGRYYEFYNNRLLHSALFLKNKGANQDLIDVLEREWRKNPQDPHINFLLGLSYKKMGKDLYKAAKFYEDAVKYGSFPGALVNLGNVYFILNNFPLAKKAYDEAKEKFPTLASVYYNYSKLLNEQLYFNEAVKEYTKAMELDKNKIDYYAKIYNYQINRVVIDEFYSDQELEQLIKDSFKETSSSGIHFWHQNLWGLSLGLLPLAAILLGILLNIHDRVRRRFLPLSRLCSTCGKVICPKCQRRSKNKNYCTQCSIIFSSSDPLNKQARDLKKAQIERKERMLRIITKITTIFIPGSGHLLLGGSVQGLIFIITWLLLIIIFIFNRNFIFSSYYIYGIPIAIKITAGIIFGFILYVIAFLTLKEEY